MGYFIYFFVFIHDLLTGVHFLLETQLSEVFGIFMISFRLIMYLQSKTNFPSSNSWQASSDPRLASL